MEVKYANDFIRDIRDVRDKKIQQKIKDTVELLKNAKKLDEVSGVKQLQGSSKHFRIRIGDYRIGFVSEKNEIILSRFLNRKEIYRHFP